MSAKTVEVAMETRFNRLILTAILVLLVIIAARPFVVEQLFSATVPRPVEARGDLADYERATIAIFDRVSPSVVQVAGPADAADQSVSGNEETAVQSGTGFVWDAAGHVVTNNHVVQGTRMLAVRLVSGAVGRASIVGVAPNYDLAVIHIDSGEPLPAPRWADRATSRLARLPLRSAIRSGSINR
jgi:S1-C subfamily serine protease